MCVDGPEVRVADGRIAKRLLAFPAGDAAGLRVEVCALGWVEHLCRKPRETLVSGEMNIGRIGEQGSEWRSEVFFTMPSEVQPLFLPAGPVYFHAA